MANNEEPGWLTPDDRPQPGDGEGVVERFGEKFQRREIAVLSAKLVHLRPDVLASQHDAVELEFKDGNAWVHVFGLNEI